MSATLLVFNAHAHCVLQAAHPSLFFLAGLLTLLFLILITTNARLILENILKYGLRFNPITFVRSALTPSGNLPLLLCWPALAAFVLAAFGIEALGVKCLRLEQKVGLWLVVRRAGRQAGR